MKIEDRDDMKLFEHTAKDGKTYQFRMPDCDIKTYDEGKHFVFQFPVWEKETQEHAFIAHFRLEAENISDSFTETERLIDEYVDKKKVN